MKLLKSLLFGIAILASFTFLCLPPKVEAANAVPGGAGGSNGDTPGQSQKDPCVTDKNTADPALCGTAKCKDASNCNLTTTYLNPIINKFLAPLAILSVVIGVIWGSIEYTTSGGDPQRVSSAKGHIAKALIGLLAFIFLYAFLNYLIPGGLI